MPRLELERARLLQDVQKHREKLAATTEADLAETPDDARPEGRSRQADGRGQEEPGQWQWPALSPEHLEQIREFVISDAAELAVHPAGGRRDSRLDHLRRPCGPRQLLALPAGYLAAEEIPARCRAK